MQALWALSLSAFPALLWASPLFLERESNASRICKPAPKWEIDGEIPMKNLQGNVVFCLTQAARLGKLRDKLALGKLTDISFLVVNEQDAQSRAMYWELKRRTAEGIPVYQQSPLQNDVWDILEGDKDDFLVYDRCGHLTFHIVLPFSFLHYPYIEAAIRATYHKNICNCSLHANSSISEGFKNNTNNANKQTEVKNQNTNNTEPVTVEHHHHRHEHHHQHVHYHFHQHVHHHHQNKNNSTGDLDVTSVPKEPIQHSHQEHSHHHS
uniref:Selenoprotein P2 n=1 Tax=Cyprinus carpio carpio TaxID=630221 RepID=A0A9J8A199_CYPCA